MNQLKDNDIIRIKRVSVITKLVELENSESTPENHEN